MIEATKDLAWKEDIPQPFTSEDIEDIKASIDIPKANVNITPYHIYDTDEHIVGEWRQIVDGVKKKKPVYEKIVNCGTLPNNATKEVNHNISNIDIMVMMDGISSKKVANNNYYQQIPRISTNSTYSVYLIGCNDAVISITTSSDLSQYVGYITLQYTKTTDEWEVV